MQNDKVGAVMQWLVSHIEAKYRCYSSFESNPWALNQKSCQNVCHFKPVLITFFCGKQKMISFPLTSNIWTKKYNGSQWQMKLFGYQHFSNYILLCTAEEIKSYRFGSTWVFCFEYSNPLICLEVLKLLKKQAQILHFLCLVYSHETPKRSG